jgi:single-strand DNA-binding protein
VRNKGCRDVREYLSKGDKIYVEGRIRSRQWQTEDGSVKYTSEIQVTEFTFCQPKVVKNNNSSSDQPKKH